jgi:hypothetical protein
MKSKPIIIIVITLVIGFVLGMLTSAQIRYSRLQPVRVFFSEERFRDGFYKVILPDEKQKETIDQLLSKYAKNNSTIQNDFRKKLDLLMNDFWKELGPSLTKEQLNRLKQMDQRRMDMNRQNRRNSHDSVNLRDNRRMSPRDSDDFRGSRRMPFPMGGRSPFHDRDSSRTDHDSSRLQNNKEQVIK